jgi:hypothetical protein
LLIGAGFAFAATSCEIGLVWRSHFTKDLSKKKTSFYRGAALIDKSELELFLKESEPYIVVVVFSVPVPLRNT